MRKFFYSLFVLVMTFTFAFAACNGGNSKEENTSSTTSETTSSEEPISSEDSEESSSSEENTSSTTSETTSSEEPITSEDSEESSSSDEVEEPPVIQEEGDLTTCEHVGSIAPDEYGVVSNLSVQNKVLSQDSTAALKGVFNGNGEDSIVYKGYIVWTFAQLRLKDHYGESVDLRQKSLVYDVKAENCGIYSSLTVVGEDGTRSNEVSFEFQDPKQTNPYISITAMKGAWYRIKVDLFYAFYDDPSVLKNAAEILIMFSNEECDEHKEDSVFYLDNVQLTKSDSFVNPDELVVYNPDGYYEKNASLLNVTFLGNSHLSRSDLHSYFDRICKKTQTQAVSYEEYKYGTSTTLESYYDLAFGKNGFMSTDVDVLFIQGFYFENDTQALGRFLAKLHEVSPTTEVKLIPWQDALTDVYQAAETYGLDVVDWKKAVDTLQSDYGFTEKNFASVYGYLNELSGYIGGMMAYMDIYGERPTLEDAKEACYSFLFDHLPGNSNAEREAAFQSVYELLTDLVLGEDYVDDTTQPDDPILNLTVEERNDLATSTCIGTRAPENYGTLATLSIQTNVRSQNSLSALEGVFNGSNAIVHQGYMVWTFAELFLKDFYNGNDASSIDLREKTLVFDLKTENMGIYGSFIVISEHGEFSHEETFSYSDLHTTDKPITRKSLGDGWHRYTLDFSDVFSKYELWVASSLLICFGNEECASHYADSIFYLDNIMLLDAQGNPLPKHEDSGEITPPAGDEDSGEITPPAGDEDSGEITPPAGDEVSNPPCSIYESADLTNDCPTGSKAPENYGVLSTITLQSTITTPDSTAALQGVFNNVGADTHEGHAVWTWVEFRLAEHFGEPVDLTTPMLRYNTKLQNCGVFSSFILVAPDGSRSKEVTFNVTNIEQCPTGLYSIPYDGGWYEIFLNFAVAYAGDDFDLTNVSSILIMYTNQNCTNPDEDSIFIIDDMELGYPASPQPGEETNDLATMGFIDSMAPAYGVQSTISLQSEVISQNSTVALKGVFNNVNAPVYDGYMVWTWADVHLSEYAESGKVNAKGLSLVYDVKTENCGIYSSFILYSTDFQPSIEVSFQYQNPAQSNPYLSCVELGGGWYRITVNLYATFFDCNFIENVTGILIMFTNQNCENPNVDSIFYIDNMSLVEAPDLELNFNSPVHNPDGPYSKDTHLAIKIVGNSFVSPYTSNSAYFLQLFCNEFGANATVTYHSIGNGRISDQYAAAFGEGGYMATEKVDVLFIQDFYSIEDMLLLGDFLTKLYEVSPTTEAKIYPGENETLDGVRAAEYYGLDVVNWRAAVRYLKEQHSFDETHLNAEDGWHPNPLAGFLGGFMMYLDLYEETSVDYEKLTNLAKEWVWEYLPGETEAQKEDSFFVLYNLATSANFLF